MTATELSKAAKAMADSAEPVILPDGLARLRDPFPASQVGQLPKGGVVLDYVGHGAVTDRLLNVDPHWSWEPMAFDQGLPRFTLDANGNPIALWIRLTVCGVTRIGCGTCRANQFDAEKVLIGDAIRNAAMRFGVALDLWIRGHAEDDEKRSADDSTPAPTRATAPAWNANQAKQHILKLLDGSTDDAAACWTYVNGAAHEGWDADWCELAVDTWKRRPMTDEPVPDPVPEQEGANQ